MTEKKWDMKCFGTLSCGAIEYYECMASEDCYEALDSEEKAKRHSEIVKEHRGDN